MKLVELLFRYAELFEEPQVFVSKSRPRPSEDRYAHPGIPNDPVYAVYAEKKGASSIGRPRPAV